MSRVTSFRANLRSVLSTGCFAGCLFTGFGSHVLAGDTAASSPSSHTIATEGSTQTHRSQVDTWSGQVYIYVGGNLPAGTSPAAFQFLFDFTEKGNTAGYITPLLFESKSVEAFTVYTVVGIGKGFEVKLNSAPQAIPFTIVEGTKAASNGTFTFGFINAIVDSNGVPGLTSPGTVDMNNPSDAGPGVGGSGTTNDWVPTVLQPSPTVALGTTFAAAGANANYTLSFPYRTYSAQVSGIVAASH